MTVEPLTPRDPKGSRTGFSTGACAAAAAKAAVRYFLQGIPLEAIETTLPNRKKVTFPLKRCEKIGGAVVTSIIKDAGDDPDCTHGAEITTTVTLKMEAGIELVDGPGVGHITKPGLGLELGSPSITPIPRRNITEMVLEELKDSPEFKGARIVISVPSGEQMARETTNVRLGIVGGISILGTTGVVQPYSTAAFRASVVQEIDVAAAQGIRELVMTTGGKSEELAMKIFPDFQEESFIQVGDFIGVGLKSAVKNKMARAHIVGMMGKLSKMADGKMQTHVAGSQVNTEFLARVAQEAGGSEDLCRQIQAANTARHALELAAKENLNNFTTLICRDVCRVAENHTAGALEVHTYLFDFNGKLLARYPIKD
jgi:cobalt-precorrin-5B (C1)-methyltransferase